MVMKEEVALKTKELEKRDKELVIREKTSLDLEVSKRYFLGNGRCCCHDLYHANLLLDREAGNISRFVTRFLCLLKLRGPILLER